MLPRSSFECVHAESFYFKAPPAACDNARKVDDKAHLHCEWMYHDYVTLCGGRRCALPPAPASRLLILEATPRGLWQNASVWYGPPSVSSVCDQTCRQNSSACCAAMLWQNHKGGWNGPPTATSSITLPLYAVTTPQRWMIRPTYIANECIMTMWRFAGGGAAPSPRAPLPPFYFRGNPPRLVTKCKCMIRPTFCFKRVWSNLSSKFKCVLCCHAVTKPQRWMIWPTNCYV